jgi:hypothetical protein
MMRTVSEPAELLAFPLLRITAMVSTVLGTASGGQRPAPEGGDLSCGPVAFLIERSFLRGPR